MKKILLNSEQEKTGKTIYEIYKLNSINSDSEILKNGILEQNISLFLNSKTKSSKNDNILISENDLEELNIKENIQKRAKTEIIPLKKHNNNKFNLVETVNLKKTFYKTVLKIKFENLHNTHKGQKIPPLLIWEEAIKNNIVKEKWNNFILDELKNPLKYVEIIINKKKKKIEPSMGIIKEE